MTATRTDLTHLARGGCGREIRCGIRYEGERLGRLAFFDAPKPGRPIGDPLTRCPGCGAPLDHHLLVDALSYRPAS